MLSSESRQLAFVFADSPSGGEDDRASDVSVGKSFLLLIANVKEANETDTRTPDQVDRLSDGFRSNNNGCLNCEAAP